MAQQLSLFGLPEPEEAPVKPKPAAASAQSKPSSEPPAAYASVVLDIPTRALSEPFAYGIPESLANEVQIGSTVLVHFGNRAAICRATTPLTFRASSLSKPSSANRSLPPRLHALRAG